LDWPLKRFDSKKLWKDASDKMKKSWLQNGIVPMDYPYPVAEDYPECLHIVLERVKPDRDKLKRKAYRERWWRFSERQPKLQKCLEQFKHVLVRARVANINSIVLVPTDIISSDATVLFMLDGLDDFAVLQSFAHTEWLTFYSSSMRTDVRYTPSDCFENFPFPESGSGLENIGEIYYSYRQDVMQRTKDGLTKTYNCFHSKEESSIDIQNLRELHIKMDTAVATAYGWSDLDLGHGFHETKQGIRFTISEDARREVLQRLLKLNHERYEEEVAKGLHDKKKKKSSTPRKKKTSLTKDDGNINLFNFMNVSQKGSK
jgi:hypothetical protein